MLGGLEHISRIRDAQTRSVSAENPGGAPAAGALASPGDDAHTAPGARTLGRGWKVRPCLRDFKPGQTLALADISGPGVVQHIWTTVLRNVHRWIRLEVFYDGADEPSIRAPLGDFFANGIDGRAVVGSIPIAVNPSGGMNSYWPMPFRERIRIDVTNDGPETIPEFFYQITYSLEPVADDAGYLHACWRRGVTDRSAPEHVVLESARGPGLFVGTYLAWTQLSTGWWGEGEVKFFIDDDPDDAPTICGTGTEDYFGGAWGFLMDHQRDQRPTTYSTPYLGYPQAVYDATAAGPRPPVHGLYRWHLPDPIRFRRRLRATVQALGWWPDGTYQPLADDIASLALWYQAAPSAAPQIGPIEHRYAR